MVLLGDMFTVSSRTLTESGEDFQIHLNAQHFIYKAHFPGEPITPGVCILQMCMELLSEHIGQKLSLLCAKNVKYLKIIVPDQTADLVVRVQKVQMLESEGTEPVVKAQITVLWEDEIYTKLSLECVKK